MVAIDFETTGVVDGQSAQPWQIGLVRLRAGRVRIEESHQRLLHVPVARTFHPRAPGRHETLRAEIEAAPTLLDLWAELQPWLVGPVLVAHNAGTERQQLHQAAPMHRFGPWIDTLKLSRVAWPDRASHKLEDLSADLGLDPRLRRLCPDAAAHDAWYDAVACGLLLEHLLGLPGWGDLTVAQLVEAKPRAFYRG